MAQIRSVVGVGRSVVTAIEARAYRLVRKVRTKGSGSPIAARCVIVEDESLNRSRNS